MAAVAIMQADPALVHQLERLVTTQTIIAVALVLVALAAIGAAAAAVLAIRKLTRTFDRTMAQLTPRLDPLLTSASRIAGDAEEIAGSVKGRMDEVLDTIEDLSGRLKSGAQAVEDRVKQFGAVVDVVQSEAEDLLLDAAATARGVHTAAEMLRSGGRTRAEPPADYDDDADDDVFTD